jgi:Lon protease-like protein
MKVFANEVILVLCVCSLWPIVAFISRPPATATKGTTQPRSRWTIESIQIQQHSSLIIHPPTTTILGQSSLSSNDSEDSNDAFMTALRTRMDKTINRMPLVVLDSMVPRQELNITIRNLSLLQLIQNRIENESPVFCMLGLARLASSGQFVPLKYGVRVEILQCQVTPAGRVSVHLKADTLLQVKDDTVTKSPHGEWTEAQVEILNPMEAEKAENSLRLAQAMWKARKLDHLVKEWIPLAKTRERIPNQVETILERLGNMPMAEEPTDRAFWVGALINPIPALGVATEIRPALLLAKSPNERVDIVIAGIRQSIDRLKQQQDEDDASG